MQVCWILLAESGDVPLRLVRTVEPNSHQRRSAMSNLARDSYG
ncbi:MAG: hypothetical protein IPM83_08020 [Ignavibacteria bacterium]|nr:hypothetical protein [Ignavibacteria bacterium]